MERGAEEGDREADNREAGRQRLSFLPHPLHPALLSRPACKRRLGWAR